MADQIHKSVCPLNGVSWRDLHLLLAVTRLDARHLLSSRRHALRYARSSPSSVERLQAAPFRSDYGRRCFPSHRRPAEAQGLLPGLPADWYSLDDAGARKSELSSRGTG